jgi:hypothetical protein
MGSNQTKIKPSRRFYLLGIAAFIIGGVLFGSFLFSSLENFAAESTIQVVVPGTSDIELPEAGKYTIFYEYQSVVGNRVFSTGEDIPGLEVTLISKDTGLDIPLFRTSLSSTYSIGGRSGISLFDFSTDKPGIFELSAFYPSGEQSSAKNIVLAVMHGFVGKLMATILWGLAIFFGSVAIGIAIIVITFLKRRKAKKRIG